jgi:uncharacterized protein (UPF0254 family)
MPQIHTLRDVLEASGPRPDGGNRNDKNAYATRFANAMAICIANGLRRRFREFERIKPSPDGTGTESGALAVRGVKRLDVNFSDPKLGLGLGISLKSVHFRELEGARGYTHNMKRNDEELRTEASGYHQRQPYAVMVAVVFLPIDAYDVHQDARPERPSSFGAWVQYLRPLAGRNEPHEDIQKFERVFIGVYDPAGSAMEFFDVTKPPPRTGRPRYCYSYEEFLDEVHTTFARRNSLEFQWAEDLPE